MSVNPRHRFRVVERQIGIFTEELSDGKFETEDGETIVMVSVSLGQTHVTVISDEAHRSSQWTAAFGWSSLSLIPVGSDEDPLTLDELPRALRGQLRRYGTPVSTSGFIEAARAHMRGAIGYILDRTIGDGAGYDRIVLAAPSWLHETVSGCLDLRPHIWKEIQDL
jgi:hypothetical protein